MYKSLLSYPNLASEIRRYPFNLIAKPISYLCNLDCHYCFYLSKEALYKGGGCKMSDETLKLFTRQYINRQPETTKELHFIWQGGEPTLLGVDFFRKATYYQRQYARSGMEIFNSFQTNGVLLDKEWASFFKENNFLIGISIDGDEEEHNRYRKFKDGRGSFSYVMKAIELLKQHGVDFNTITTVHACNVKEPQKVYRFLKSIGSTFMQFIPIVEVEWEVGGTTRGLSPNSEAYYSSPRSVGSLEWGIFLCEVFNLWLDDIGEIFVPFFEVIVAMLCGYPSPLCTFRDCCGRAMIIEHNGDIYSCDHYVFKENKIGNIHQKDLELIVNCDKQIDFSLQKYLNLASKCKACKFKGLCYGECPANRISKTDSEEKINYLCEGYYHFYSTTFSYFEAIAKAIKAGDEAKKFKKYL